MSWIAPFRSAIMAQAPRLQKEGFSWIGEDEIRIRFTDGDIELMFVGERYENWLSVWVRYLGDSAGDARYRLDFVMQIVDAIPPHVFDAKTQDDWMQLIARYVDYILLNKSRLFGADCPYAMAYEEFDRRGAEEAMAQWARKS
ncbi:hypothetical protein BurJ1DRAFT_4403 [Burkholderiales bacterium JOSHI_001]|nr:hypothetical protein BurJ1DRAFT_4403 [Burkholderiales bacterium JOSHI_001]